jgi:hypothetical protein
MNDVPVVPERPASPRPARRRPGGCLMMALVVGGLMVFTVVVVVSLNVAGIIGGKGSRSEQDRLLAEIREDYGIGTSSRDLEHPPQRDLQLGACDRSDDGTVHVNGSVTNFTDEPARYEITVVVREGSGDELGAELGSTVVTVEDVPPQRTVPWNASWEVRPRAAVTCTVPWIERDEP